MKQAVNLTKQERSHKLGSSKMPDLINANYKTTTGTSLYKKIRK